MRTVLSTTCFVLMCSCFIACSDDEQQNGTDQSATNTLASLINPNANTATATTSAAALNTLQDTWILAKRNSEQKYEVNLVNNIPVLDLDSARSSMSGHTGCNSLSGKLKVRGNKLVFDSFRVTSNQPCSDKGFEKKTNWQLQEREHNL